MQFFRSSEVPVQYILLVCTALGVQLQLFSLFFLSILLCIVYLIAVETDIQVRRPLDLDVDLVLDRDFRCLCRCDGPLRFRLLFCPW